MYLEPCETSMAELFSQKSYVINVTYGPKYTSKFGNFSNLKFFAFYPFVIFLEWH